MEKTAKATTKAKVKPKPRVRKPEAVDPGSISPPEPRLTDKQRFFIESYLQCWNATEAARQAGYDGNETTLAAIGWENLRKPLIAEAVSKRISEVAMSADEVLRRLAAVGRGSMDCFIDEDGYFDLGGEKARANRHLIKKVKVKKRVGGPEDDPWTETETEVELHDPMRAMETIGRHHKLFTDRVDHTGIPTVPTVVIMPDNNRTAK